MLLKIKLKFKLSGHQKRRFYSLLGDNTDHNINIFDGKNIHHHGLGSIMVANANFSSESK